MATRTISDVRAQNEAIGNHWFDRASMRFFKTKIESSLIRGKYFITSEIDWRGVKKFSVREALEDGSINTVGPFHHYRSKEEAKEAIKSL